MRILTRKAIATGLREARRIENGYVPTAADLAGAPILSDWMIEPLPGGLYRLFGTVNGHPSVHDGWCMTSPVLAADPLGKWVRTVSRYYRLGPAMGELMLREVRAKRAETSIMREMDDDPSA